MEELFEFLLLPLLSLLAESLEVATPSCDAQLVDLHCLLRLPGLEDLRQQETISYLHTIITCSSLYFGLDRATDVSKNQLSNCKFVCSVLSILSNPQAVWP